MGQQLKGGRTANGCSIYKVEGFDSSIRPINGDKTAVQCNFTRAKMFVTYPLAIVNYFARAFHISGNFGHRLTIQIRYGNSTF